MKHHLSLLLPSTLLILAACSGSDKSDAVTYDVTADVTLPAEAGAPEEQTKKEAKAGEPAPALTSDRNIDSSSEPYILGREHAVRLHSGVNSAEELRDELLDINARVTNIRNRIGTEAADNYVAGLRDYLKENSDTLYNVLF